MVQGFLTSQQTHKHAAYEKPFRWYIIMNAMDSIDFDENSLNIE